MVIKPMLAARVTDDQVRGLAFPVLASPKLDGVRGIVVDGVLRSRSFKTFPNKYVQERFSKPEYNGLDGELILGPQYASDVYRRTNSAVSSFDGMPDVKFHIFDNYLIQRGFGYRHDSLYERPFGSIITVVPHVIIHSYEQLIAFEQKMLKQGYEGVMVRDPTGRYKHGRSTYREGGLIKVKRFHDGEACILEVVEEMQNTNEGVRNVLGKLERSSHKANMIPKGRAGALRVRDCSTNVEFHVGTGMDDSDRTYFWKHRVEVIGKVIKYKHFEVGKKDLPRFPVFLGLREDFDR